MKKFNTILFSNSRVVSHLVHAKLVLGLVLLISIFTVTPSNGQDNPAYIESTGLVVMQAESVPRPTNWKFENTEEGHTGAGYLRYIGSNHFNEPGFDIMEYNVVIEHPGEYKMFVWMSHIGAPEPDQENDIWTRMDEDGTWIKTVHPSPRVEEGFSFHTQWVERIDGVEVFSEPTYQLDAGVHTLFVSGRSWNVRVDRIHLWKNDAPFKITYDNASLNTYPETERDGTVLTALPNQVTFPATPLGQSADPIGVSLTNGGEENITVTGVNLTGTNAADFSTNFSGSITVTPTGVSTINVTFDPVSQGFKTAKMNIEHSGLNSPTAVDLFGTATSGGTGTTILFRVNAGGPLLSDGAGDWEEDQTATEFHDNGAAEPGTPHPYVNAQANGDWTFGRDETVTLDASVPPGTPVDMFKRGRWDPGSAPTQQWDIPIDAGKEIEVRLYFSEQFFTGIDIPADQGYPRLFDVTIDGQLYTQFDNINIFETVGNNVGMMRSVVIVSDGNVDVDLQNISHDPIIQGIEIVEVGSVSKAFDVGWNLVGLPTEPANANYESVFADVNPTLAPFGWDGSGYESVSDLVAGAGYWILVDEAGSQTFDDAGVTSITLNLTNGWNMISGPICLMPFASIADPSSIMVPGTLFSYSNGYQESTAMLPSAGYWVLTNKAGQITMNCETIGNKTAAAGAAVDAQGFGSITITDNNGSNQALRFGSGRLSELELMQFAMPPQSPVDAFDVRFASNSRLSQGDEHLVSIRSNAYPVNVQFNALPEAHLGSMLVEELADGEVVRSYNVYAGDGFTITSNQVNGIRISGNLDAPLDVPSQFELRGNYPNPFNPTTNLIFDMPATGSVRVDVYDLLGRRVMSLPVQEVSAGAGRQIALDASSLASGTYLYHLQVEAAGESSVRVGRMTLLK